MKKNHAISIVAILLFALSCETNTECGTIFTNEAVVAFVVVNSQGNIVADANRNRFDSIYESHSLHILYDTSLVSGSAYSLPLNPQKDTSTFFFARSGIVDTLSLRYTKGFRFRSPECGMLFEYRNLEVLQHSFDTISVVKDTLLRGQVNVQVFF